MRKRAYTLTEILIAVAVAAVALLAMASLTVSVWRATKYAKYTAYASSLARQPLERMRGDASYFRSLYTGPPESRRFSEEFEAEEGKRVPFNGEITFSLLPPPRDRYVRIVSRVYWTQEGIAREAVLETVYPIPPDPIPAL